MAGAASGRLGLATRRQSAPATNPHLRQRLLCRDSFDGQMMHIGAFTRMFERNGAHIAAGIEVEDRVFVEVLGLGDFAFSSRIKFLIGAFCAEEPNSSRGGRKVHWNFELKDRDRRRRQRIEDRACPISTS